LFGSQAIKEERNLEVVVVVETYIVSRPKMERTKNKQYEEYQVPEWVLYGPTS
jgi:hypothetical protein